MPEFSRGNLFTWMLGIFLDNTLTGDCGVCAGSGSVTCTQAQMSAAVALVGGALCRDLGQLSWA